MNREILFRGQTRKRGEKVRMDGTPVDGNWVYGGIFPGEGDFSIIYSSRPVEKHVVYTSTVGQYTEKNDRNQHRAFVGDIVRYRNEQHTVYGIIRFGEITDTEGRSKHIGYYIEWQNDGADMWGDWWRRDLGYWLDDPHCEICGNIHDNPELLEGR